MSFVFQDLNILDNRESLQRSSPFSPNRHQRVFPRNRLLVWLTYWCDYHLYGENAARWRLTSAVIHTLNAMFLFLISPLAALLFFLHPLTLMGSSYIAGRSGMMSATFQIAIALLAVHAWWKTALVLAVIATRWLKEDSLIFFPMLAILAIVWAS